VLKNIGQYAILLVFIAAVLVITYIACTAMGVIIPAWVVNVFWVLVIAFVCIAAIRLLIGGTGP
jgi:hypothetical protein